MPAASAILRPAVFLDRDDTILDTRRATAHLPRPGDLFDPSLVRLMPGAAAAVKSLSDAGFALVVYTSQGGIARGPMPGFESAPDSRSDVEHLGLLGQVERVNDTMRAMLAAAGAKLAGLYYCPFHPQGTVPRFSREHSWRKPGPGMILAAASELDIDIASSWAVGDQQRDVEAAMNAGIAESRALLISTTDNRTRWLDLPAAAAHIVGK